MTLQGPYFDDLVHGQVFTSRRRTIAEADVVLFASLAGLLSPLFHDEVYAREQHFGRRVAPGPLTFTYAVGLTEDLTHGSVLAALGFDDIRFHRPVHPGDTIHVRSEVVGTRPSSSRPDTGIVSMRHVVHNQQDDVVASYVRTVLYGTRSYFGVGDP